MPFQQRGRSAGTAGRTRRPRTSTTSATRWRRCTTRRSTPGSPTPGWCVVAPAELRENFCTDSEENVWGGCGKVGKGLEHPESHGRVCVCSRYPSVLLEATGAPGLRSQPDARDNVCDHVRDCLWRRTPHNKSVSCEATPTYCDGLDLDTASAGCISPPSDGHRVDWRPPRGLRVCRQAMDTAGVDRQPVLENNPERCAARAALSLFTVLLRSKRCRLFSVFPCGIGPTASFSLLTVAALQTMQLSMFSLPCVRGQHCGRGSFLRLECFCTSNGAGCSGCFLYRAARPLTANCGRSAMFFMLFIVVSNFFLFNLFIGGVKGTVLEPVFGWLSLSALRRPAAEPPPATLRCDRLRCDTHTMPITLSTLSCAIHSPSASR